MMTQIYDNKNFSREMQNILNRFILKIGGGEGKDLRQIVTSTQNHQIILLFNIIKIFNKFKIFEYHQIQKYNNINLRKQDFLSEEKSHRSRFVIKDVSQS